MGASTSLGLGTIYIFDAFENNGRWKPELKSTLLIYSSIPYSCLPKEVVQLLLNLALQNSLE